MRDRVAVLVSAGLAGVVLGSTLLSGATLLLHPGPGALATAGFLIALSLAAVGAALWVGVPERVSTRPRRWRWILAVVSLLLAGLIGELWLRDPAIRGVGWGRAVAVLILIAVPAYLVGSVLALHEYQERTTGAPAGGAVGVAALAGGAMGALIAAVWVIPKFDPAVNFVGGAIVLLMGAWVGGVEGGGRGSHGERGRSDQMEGKVAIVTGAGVPGQVGVALVEALLARGARVIMTARSHDPEPLARELGGARALGVVADLSRPDDADAVVARALSEFGRLDLLVNVAGGLTVMKPLAETTPEEWSREIEGNAETAFVMSRAAIAALRESRGTIINFASPAGIRAQRGLGAYSAAKAAVIAQTRALALEERGSGVRVNAIAPGMIDTEQNRASVSEPEQIAWVRREEIADLVLFLASEEGRGVNGATIEMVGSGGRG